MTQKTLIAIVMVVVLLFSCKGFAEFPYRGFVVEPGSEDLGLTEEEFYRIIEKILSEEGRGRRKEDRFCLRTYDDQGYAAVFYKSASEKNSYSLFIGFSTQCKESTKRLSKITLKAYIQFYIVRGEVREGYEDLAKEMVQDASRAYDFLSDVLSKLFVPEKDLYQARFNKNLVLIDFERGLTLNKRDKQYYYSSGLDGVREENLHLRQPFIYETGKVRVSNIIYPALLGCTSRGLMLETIIEPMQ